jgi:retron-type reverse transcriptase
MSSTDALRERISQIGRAGAIIEQMIKLGFINDEDLRKLIITQNDVKQTLEQLGLIDKERLKLKNENAALDLKVQLKEIRRERIEMVKAKRQAKKLQQLKDRPQRAEDWEREKRSKLLFLGTGVSSKLTYQSGDVSKLEKYSLPNLSTALDLAQILSITTEDLLWLCYERGASTVDHYSRFQIPKRSGGYRIISSPKPKMRAAQIWINESILRSIQPSNLCFAFRPNLSIVDNAKQHLNKKVIVKMDIKDFFPSITFPRVRGYFEFLGYNPGIATLLALLCTDAPKVRVTYKSKSQFVAIAPRSLPQGAVTSPALANLIASRLDQRLFSLLRNTEDIWNYSRYADDLTFSTDNPHPKIGPLMGVVRRITSDEKFVINPDKTKVMRAPHRQSVTGLVVGQDVRLHKSHIKRIRALFHRIDSQGKDLVSAELGGDALAIAKGNLAYLHMVQPKIAQKYQNKYKWLR